MYPWTFRTLLFGAAALAGCPAPKEDRLTLSQALQAVEEASLDAQAAQVTSGAVEISTNFTLGQAVEAAAAELRSWIESQLPCARVTVTGATLAVQYGARPGSCLYKGLRYSGSTTVTLRKIADGEVVVEHGWTDLSDQRIKVSGTATVTWSFDERYRRVQHQATWTRLSDGRTGTGSGDRVQTPLEGGVLEGIQVDGSRSWTGTSGTWDLAIDSVRMRWADPVPESGRYTLGTPSGHALSLGFSRIDDDVIRVTVEGGRNAFRFDVRRAGNIEQR